MRVTVLLTVADPRCVMSVLRDESPPRAMVPRLRSGGRKALAALGGGRQPLP